MSINNTSKGLLLNLPLDEVKNASVANLAETALPQSLPVSGNPQVNYDYYMGSSVAFSGKEGIEISGLNFSDAKGVTAELWFNPDDLPSGNTCLFCFENIGTQKGWSISANHDQNSMVLHDMQTQTNYILFTLVDYGKWIYMAITCDPSGNLKCIVNANVLYERNIPELSSFFTSKESFRLTLAHRPGDGHYFRGKISQFKLYNHTLTAEELEFSMNRGLSINARFKATYPVDFKLNSVSEGNENPVLYIENDGAGHALKLSMINTSGTEIYFRELAVNTVAVPAENTYHVQLRFKRQVLAENVLKSLSNVNSSKDNQWKYIAGSTDSLHEDWISFIRTDARETFKDLLSFLLDHVSASALAGARNTLVEIKYNNLHYKGSELVLNGSLTRHLDIISHLGSKVVPFEAVVEKSGAVLNDGTSLNSVRVYLYNTGQDAIRFKSKQGGRADYSKFILHTRDSKMFKQYPVASMRKEGRPSVFNSIPQTTGKWIHTFECQSEGVLLEKGEYLILELNNFTTEHFSGTVTLQLEYQNVSGYWDGEIPISLHLGKITEWEGKTGINTNYPKADLHVYGTAKVSSVLEVGDRIETDLLVAKQLKLKGGTSLEGNLQIQGKTEIGRESSRSELVVNGTTSLQGNTNIHGEASVNGVVKIKNTTISEESNNVLKTSGRIHDQTGYLMPVGSVIAFAGKNLPEGWLLCDGSQLSEGKHKELIAVLGSDLCPDLRTRFVTGADPRRIEYNLHKTGGKERVQLSVNEMPRHHHSINSGNFGIHERSFMGSGDNDKPFKTEAGHRLGTDHEGGNESHENLPPYYALFYIIKY